MTSWVACLQGIQTAVDLGIGHPIIETDAKLAVQAITTNDFDEAAVGLFIAEIKSLVSSAFLALSACLKVENVIKLLTS
jgi:ribonuclease HI